MAADAAPRIQISLELDADLVAWFQDNHATEQERHSAINLALGHHVERQQRGDA